MNPEPEFLSVLLIGCGRIAGGFDEDRPPGGLPVTHAGAFAMQGGFRLSGCVEPNEQRRLDFMSHWSIPQGHAAASLVQERSGSFDVISICSPTAQHVEHLEAAVRLKPRLIFCEKPVTPTLAQTAYWVRQCEEEGILLAVNHTRRWAPDVLRFREELRSGQWGKLRSVVGHYNKGVLNNGGHMVDLLQNLLGDLEIVSVGQPVWDFWEDDPTVPACLTAGQGVPIYLNAAHANDYAYFEVQFVTSTAVLMMEDGGAHWRVRQAADSPTFHGYKSLSAGERRAGEYQHAMLNAVTNIRNAVLTGAPLASTGRSALQVQTICERMKVMACADTTLSS